MAVKMYRRHSPIQKIEAGEPDHQNWVVLDTVRNGNVRIELRMLGPIKNQREDAQACIVTLTRKTLREFCEAGIELADQLEAEEKWR